VVGEMFPNNKPPMR